MPQFQHFLVAGQQYGMIAGITPSAHRAETYGALLPLTGLPVALEYGNVGELPPARRGGRPAELQRSPRRSVGLAAMVGLDDFEVVVLTELPGRHL